MSVFWCVFILPVNNGHSLVIEYKKLVIDIEVVIRDFFSSFNLCSWNSRVQIDLNIRCLKLAVLHS